MTFYDLDTCRAVGGVRCAEADARAGGLDDIEFVSDDLLVAFGNGPPAMVRFGSAAAQRVDHTAWSQVAIGGEPGAERLVAVTDDQRVALYQAPGLSPLPNLERLSGERVWTAAISPTGRYVAAGLDRGRLAVFDLERPSASLEFVEVDESKESVVSLAFRRDDRWLGFGTFSGKAGLVAPDGIGAPEWLQAPDLESATGRPASRQAHAGVISDLRFSPDGRRMLTCGAMDMHARIWSVEGVCEEALFTGGVATFGHLLADGRLVLLTEQGELSVWRVGASALLAHLRSRTNAVLLASERIRYLGEDPATARQRYAEDERARGRTPLPPEYARIDFR